MIQGHCHCGAVAFEILEQPEILTACNCSICRRYGALWAHAALDQITIIADPGATRAYIWGDKMLAFHSCKTCGCITHWENLQPDPEHMAVNFRMCEPDLLQGVRVRQFDGADTWEYLD